MIYRSYYLAREWVRLGHKVSIVAASFSHLRTHETDTVGSVTKEEIDGIQYIWLKTPRYQGNSIRRVLSMMVFSLQLVLFKSKIVSDCKPDLVIASSPQPFIIFGAKRIACSSCAKLIFEVRDLWPLSLCEVGGISPRHPFMAMMQWVEDYALRVSDKVTSTLPKADGYMISRGMPADKFCYVANGIDVTEWGKNEGSLPSEHNDVLCKLKNAGRFVVGYAGAHGIPNALDSLVDAAALLQDFPVTVVMVGQGIKKEHLRARAGELGIENIEFLPPVPKLSMPELLEKFDVLFIGWLKSPVYRFGISPNKLFDYMMAAKPVVHSVDAGNDLVAESGCGISVPPEDPKAISDTIIRLFNMAAAEREAMGSSGRNYVLARHDYRALARHYLEAVGYRQKEPVPEATDTGQTVPFLSTEESHGFVH